jgi:hypothetical protein
MTRKKLIARLDRVFSQWVRSKDADHRGYVQCFTCGVWKHWKTVDAGHFQSRAKFSTRWDERNVKCQCKPATDSAAGSSTDSPATWTPNMVKGRRWKSKP